MGQVLHAETWDTDAALKRTENYLMKHFKILALFYALILGLFALGKVAFIFAQEAGIRGNLSAGDVVGVLWHGLSLDLATAGYVTAPLLAHAWHWPLGAHPLYAPYI